MWLDCRNIYFAHIECDCDIEPILEIEEFKTLISKYKMLLEGEFQIHKEDIWEQRDCCVRDAFYEAGWHL